MSYVTTSDGVDIFYKDWGPRDAEVFFSIMVGHFARMIGMPNYYIF